ncbi:E3 ubiquitin-protein ligase RNF135-like [Dunckerocampus dactyliophorus]|uniref:E3 ubiquitin-protein ligase RNF135-like n=1 Tax=Dunckerocampus dactyliophorus TaxID=161453 RepID=UPI00240497F3|nr:E3 ubiquitin-protein ligase RNF135-like [Dunckerocampus dactyliophorus]
MSLPEDVPVHVWYTEPHNEPKEAERQQCSKDQEVLPRTGQRKTRTLSPMRIFREDLNHFKEDFLNVFKDSRLTQEDPQNRTALSLLKDDLNQFKEDMSNVFRIKDNTNTKIKARGREHSEERVRGHQKQSSEEQEIHKAAAGRTLSEPRPDQMDMRPNEDVLQEKTTSLGISKSCGTWTDAAGDHHEEDGPSQSLPLDLLGRVCWRDAARQQLDGTSVKNFACYLTFDPNTANAELQLSECNRKATRVWSNRRPGEHPDRFQRCPQVLCREGLLEAAYWEVQWSGGADVGVAYNNISRDGDVASCLLGHNPSSWSLECSAGSYSACHDNKRVAQCTPRPFTHRVGVYLDWPAGSLSFYCVSKDTMVHIHTFTSTFTEALYPAFWVWPYQGSVSLCQVELDWERLLQ